MTVLVLHVNDCFIRAYSEAMLDRIIKQWDDKYPGVTHHRWRIIVFIGMMLDCTIKGEVTITQKRFIDKLLIECEDIICESNSPHSTELFTVDENSSLLDNKKQDLLHSRTQSLLYTVKRTTPDLQIAVGFLGKRVKKAAEEDWSKLCNEEFVILDYEG